MIRRLALVRHSIPAIDETVPANEWRLSDEGRTRCRDSVDTLRGLATRRIFTSHEPKAIETAEELGRELGLPVVIASGVHEHERPRLPFYDQSTWHRMVADLFAKPDTLVFGNETANQARSRFVEAVNELARSTPDEDLIVVTHGTVISLYLAQIIEQDAFTIWQSLEMPDVRIVPLDAAV